MEKLLRIGQISNLYGISLDTLRYYDHKGLLKPVIDEENGYRYYSLQHLDILEMILLGKYLEIPLEQLKEKIYAENIKAYLELMEEQNLLIQQKLSVLEKLYSYTNQMAGILKQIENFSNDASFSSLKIEENLKVALYQVDLKDFPNNLESAKKNELQELTQWLSYRVEDNGLIAEASEMLGFSTEQDLGIISEEGKNLNLQKNYLRGRYGLINFWGNHDEIKRYINKLCGHFNLKNTSIHLKFLFALPNKDMNHQYFIEIYFKQ